MNEDRVKMRNEQWREDLRKSIPAKERAAIERTPMPELDPKERIKCYDEVNQGFSKEQAMHEATRCLDCPNPGCVKGCPVNINIPTFIKNIERGNFAEAVKTLKQTSSLSAVCGRVCPQEVQCESQCIHLKMGHKAVSIGALERFAADWQRDHGDQKLPEMEPANGIKVAAIGSGPSGLSFAGDMAKLGYDVTVFESLHELGGVMRYGIPVFRLPNHVIDYEIEGLRKMGVKFETNCIVGKTITYDDLHEMGFKGIFVGNGAGYPRFMNIPGEQLNGIMSSNEYLIRINLMGAGRGGDTPVLTGKTVAVIGGGNTAMDSTRTALRNGAEKVLLIYRRSEDEMPACKAERKEAKDEGVEFMTLHNPVEYIGDENGHVKAMRIQRIELGEPDESGRRSPVPVEGAIEEIPVDLVIVAVGVAPNQTVSKSIKNLETTRWNTIVVDEATQQSNIDDIYAGGDIVRGGATVILAMGDGRRAARNMHEKLCK